MPCIVLKRAGVLSEFVKNRYRSYDAGIGKEIVFKGVNDWFEVWDRKKWEAHRAAYKKREAEEE